MDSFFATFYSYVVRDALDVALAFSAHGRVEDHPNVPGLSQVRHMLQSPSWISRTQRMLLYGVGAMRLPTCVDAALGRRTAVLSCYAGVRTWTLTLLALLCSCLYTWAG